MTGTPITPAWLAAEARSTVDSYCHRYNDAPVSEIAEQVEIAARPLSADPLVTAIRDELDRRMAAGVRFWSNAKARLHVVRGD